MLEGVRATTGRAPARSFPLVLIYHCQPVGAVCVCSKTGGICEGGKNLQNNLVVEGDEKILGLIRLQHQAAFQRAAAMELICCAFIKGRVLFSVIFIIYTQIDPRLFVAFKQLSI